MKVMCKTMIKPKASLNFALSLNKDEDALYYDLAFVDMDMENTDEAIKDLNEAISINKDYYKYYRTLGTVYFNDKKL